jgi:hypothetical protein
VGNKSHPIRDLWIYLRVSELQSIKGWKKTRVIYQATKEIGEIGEKGTRKGLNLSLSPQAFWAAYKRGEKHRRNKNFKFVPPPQPPDGKRIGHRPLDAVNNYIMYAAVCEALESTPKPSIREALRIASRQLREEWKGIPYVKCSLGRVQSGYYLTLENLATKPPRTKVKK